MLSLQNLNAAAPSYADLGEMYYQPTAMPEDLELSELFDIDALRAGAGSIPVIHHPFQHKVGLGIAAHNSHDGGLMGAMGTHMNVDYPAPPQLPGLDDDLAEQDYMSHSHFYPANFHGDFSHHADLTKLGFW